MDAYIIDRDGTETKLPALLSWDVCHGFGEPCDYFDISFQYEENMLPALASACRFRAEHEGETVFFGVVDEYEISLDEKGRTCLLSGRSLEALLLDNEAEAATYELISLDTVIREHVTPYGIADVDRRAMPPLSAFSVSTGDSEWSVLKRFCRFSADIQPYFDKGGRLKLKEPDGKSIVISKSSEILSASLTDERYGIISEVLVKSRYTGRSYTERNEKFIARGGCARQVLTVPRNSGADKMRYTGRYQIRESEKDKRRLVLCLPEPFAASPGDRAELDGALFGLRGELLVTKSRCTASAAGYGTTLTLEVPYEML